MKLKNDLVKLNDVFEAAYPGGDPYEYNDLYIGKHLVSWMMYAYAKSDEDVLVAEVEGLPFLAAFFPVGYDDDEGGISIPPGWALILEMDGDEENVVEAPNIWSYAANETVGNRESIERVLKELPFDKMLTIPHLDSWYEADKKSTKWPEYEALVEEMKKLGWEDKTVR